MSTTILNTGVAIGFAQPSKPARPATVARPVATPAARKRTLMLGALAVTSCAAAVVCFKAAMVFNEFLTTVNAAYDPFCS